MPAASPQLPIAHRGRRAPDGAVVEVQAPAGAWSLLDPRLDLRHHSPAGCEWGHGGSGPAPLALAASRPPAPLARTVYQPLKRALVANFDREWHLTASRPDEPLAGLVSAGIAADLARRPSLPATPVPEVAAS